MSYSLSKSTFIKYLQCDKSLYLYKNNRNLKDPVSAATQLVFDRGHSVGDYAHNIFPNGVDCSWDKPWEYEPSLKKTAACIKNNTEVIYEGAFLADDTIVAADILVKEGEGYHVYEVKSSILISETYLRDAALQYNIIQKAGLIITGFSLITLNKDYIKSGEIEPNKLFKINDVTDQIRSRQLFVETGLRGAKDVLALKSVPNTKIGDHCREPYSCDFIGHCWQNYQKDTVFQLEGLPEEKKWEYYRQNIIDLKSIKEESLSTTQKISKRAYLQNDYYIEPYSLQTWIGKTTYPIIFLDFHFIRPAIPIIDGTSPYQSQLYLFSIIKLKEDNQTEIKLNVLPDYDLEAFTRELSNQLEGMSSILVYNKGTDVERLKNLFLSYQLPVDYLNKIVDMHPLLMERKFWHGQMKENMSITDLAKLINVQMQWDKLEFSIPEQANAFMEDVLNTNFKDKEIKLTKLKNYSGFINTAQFRFFNLLKNKYSITN